MKSSRSSWLRRITVSVVLIGVAVAALAGYLRRTSVQARSDLPVATARKGDFLVIVTCRGELVAGSSVQITAPNVPDLRIIWQAAPDSVIKEGEPVLRFDGSGVRRQLQEKEAALKQAHAALEQAVAQARISEQQGKLELSAAQHAVERARLEISKAEIVSALQAEESKIDHGLSIDKMHVQEATMELNKASAASKVASLTSQRDKVQAEVDLLNRRLERMEVPSPSSGVVSYLMNYSQGWMNAKPFKVGDQVWPGSSVAEIPTLDSLQLKARVEETDRGKIHPGQPVTIHLDPFPEKPFPGKLAGVSALTEQNFEWPPSRSFKAYAAFDQLDQRLRPGMNGRLHIVVDRIANAISVPAKAVTVRQGKPFVLVPGPEGLKPRSVEVIARNPDEVAVRGIDEGTQVVLVESESEPAPGAGAKK